MRVLFLLLVMMPLIEIWLIFRVGGLIGIVPTIALIVFTAAAGAFLLRREGVATLFRAQRKMGEGALPAQEMAEGVMLAFAGAMLLTPGFVTDIFGFLLLSRRVRTAVVKKFSGQFQVMGGQQGFGQQGFDPQVPPVSDDVIEGEFHRDDQPPR